jgi:hypothetical protein
MYLNVLNQSMEEGLCIIKKKMFLLCGPQIFNQIFGPQGLQFVLLKD